MSRTLVPMLLLLCSVAAIGSVPDQEELRALYTGYTAALAARDGPKAASCLHSNILDSYGEALALALTANRDDLKSATPQKKLIALYLRGAATPKDLAAMASGGDVVAFMVGRGALRTESQAGVELRDFSPEGEQVFASLYANGRNTHLRLRFAKEAGEWKVDLSNLDDMADDVFTQAAKMQGISVDEAVLRLVQQSLGRPLGEAIWTPLEPASGTGTAAR